MTNGINVLIDRANKLLNEYRIIAEEIAKAISDAIKDVVEVEWSLGWYEAGIDTICFYKKENSDINNKNNIKNANNMDNEVYNDNSFVEFMDIVEKVFPDLKYSDEKPMTIYTPYGIYLSKSVAEEVERRLIQLRNGLLNNKEAGGDRK